MISWTEFERQQPALAAAVASCLLTLTQPDGAFPKGPTIWKA